jgi:Stress responsive A/B Barrel Domain
MIRHVAMFRWMDGVEAGHTDRLAERLDTLPTAIPEIRGYVHGRDLGLAPGNYHYAVVADFDTVDDLATYREHPVHRALIDDLLTGFVADRAAVQYEH